MQKFSMIILIAFCNIAAAQPPLKKLFGNTAPTDSLWTAATTPVNVCVPDSPVTLGTVFKCSSPSIISHIHFYRGTGCTNTNTITVTLWSFAGASLGTGTISTSATGWIRVKLTTPVALLANTNYVVSYFSPSGDYATTLNYFTSDVTVGRITAPASATVSGNGRYFYTATAADFPIHTDQETSFFVGPILIVQ